MIQDHMFGTNPIQLAWSFDGTECASISLPSPDAYLLPSVKWGFVEELFSAAFWKFQASNYHLGSLQRDFRLGENLLEEVAVCLLGGFGMPAELGLRAFQRLKSRRMLSGTASAAEIEDALNEPFDFFGKRRRYRFARQKARYLSESLQRLCNCLVPDDHLACREMLTSLPGIGPKTASWIVRNYYGSDQVAILDVHILRAGAILGIFEAGVNPSKHYFELERVFLEFCDAIDEPASAVDAVMWDAMRRIKASRLSLH